MDNGSQMCCEPFAFLSLQIGRLEAALEDVVQDRRRQVHDGRTENATVDENVRQAEGGKDGKDTHFAHLETTLVKVCLRRVTCATYLHLLGDPCCKTRYCRRQVEAHLFRLRLLEKTT